MDRQESLIRAIQDLPVLSPVVGRITQVVSNADSSVAAVVDALKLDPVVCGKVLRLANSAYVGIPRTISSVKNAVVLLGQKRIHSLVLASTALAALKKDVTGLPFSLYRYWKHSIMVAMVAESIARHLKRYGPIDTEDVFSAGLLHDIGKLVLGIWNASALEGTVRKSIAGNGPFHSVEEASVSHTVAGGVLCDHWNFPQTLKSAIMFHHDPEKAAEFRRCASIVHMADAMAHIIGFSTFEREALPQPLACAEVDVNLPPERLRVIADDALKNEKKTESFINFLT
jgi:putative nucleotidyltransferase with HDIG domain